MKIIQAWIDMDSLKVFEDKTLKQFEPFQMGNTYSEDMLPKTLIPDPSGNAFLKKSVLDLIQLGFDDQGKLIKAEFNDPYLEHLNGMICEGQNRISKAHDRFAKDLEHEVLMFKDEGQHLLAIIAMDAKTTTLKPGDFVNVTVGPISESEKSKVIENLNEKTDHKLKINTGMLQHCSVQAQRNSHALETKMRVATFEVDPKDILQGENPREYIYAGNKILKGESVFIVENGEVSLDKPSLESQLSI